MKHDLSAPWSAATASAANHHTKLRNMTCCIRHELSVKVTIVEPRPKETAGNSMPLVGVSCTATTIWLHEFSSSPGR